MSEEVTLFNPFDKTWWSDPYPLYQRLLRDAPAGNVAGMPLYYFARFRDCEQILRDSRFGVDERKSSLYQALGPDAVARPEPAILRSFLFLDPPDHSRIRGLVSRSFTPRVVEAMREAIGTQAERLVEGMPEGEVVDLVSSLAYPLPVSVICDLLAIPYEDRPRFNVWSRHLVASLDPELFVEEEVLSLRLEALRELRDYMTELVDSRRARPGADLISLLLATIHSTEEEAAATMNGEELVATLVLLLVAGYETTANLIANGLLALARHPDVLAQLRAAPGCVTQVVEEVLRFDPPVQLTSRIAHHDVAIGEVVVPAGSFAVVLLAAANRDPARFDRPDDFEIFRGRVTHLSFSLGAHHCLGAPLARAEAELAIAAIVDRFGRVELAGEPAYRETIVLRGIEQLPMCLSVE